MRQILSILLFTVISSTLSAQVKFGITAGVNMANEIAKFDENTFAESFKKSSLNGVVLGPTLEVISKKKHIGFDISALFSQKGSNFSYDIENQNIPLHYVLEGYRSSNYVEFPLNLKYKIGPSNFCAIVSAGVYWASALGGNITVESAIDVNNANAELPDLIKDYDINFGEGNAFDYQKSDYGLNLGLGVDVFKTLQFGVNYSYGLKDTSTDKTVQSILSAYTFNDGDLELNAHNSVFSVRVSYLF